MFSESHENTDALTSYKIIGETPDGEKMSIGGEQYKMNFESIYRAAKSKDQNTMTKVISKFHRHYQDITTSPKVFKSVSLVKTHYVKNSDGRLTQEQTVLSNLEI